jgi:hypothetical protein
MFLVVISKIFNKIVLELIMRSLESGLRMEQAGFLPNRSFTDQINTLRIIIEQSLEFHSPLYLMFVDYKRVFDSINRECISNALRERGLPNKFINLCFWMRQR